MAFCICIQVSLKHFSVVTILSFLEYLLQSNVSVHMIVNYISALKAMSIIYSLPHDPFDHPQIKYFIRSIKTNRPLVVSRKNIMDIPTLTKLVDCCLGVSNSKTFKAMFLTAFFGFFRLSNLAPHAIREFDPTRHFTAGDIFFDKQSVKLLLKWSKTIQHRDSVKVITLPRLKSLSICPYAALKDIMRLYAPGSMDPLFQCYTVQGWQVMTDARVRKMLSHINLKMHLPKNYYTFHAFRRSGATLAYRAHAPIQGIKDHGTWTSDCVWRYIQTHQASGSQVAAAFQKVLL